MLKKCMVTKAPEIMLPDIIDNKKDLIMRSFLYILNNYAFEPNAFLLNTIRIPTPVEIATSAILKIALKNVKFLPPKTGTQLGIG